MKKISLFAAALALGLATQAQATVILDTAVTSQFSPYAAGTGTNGNDLPGKPSALYYGQLKASTAGTVNFYYIGNEAGYTNTLVYGNSGTLLSGSGSFSTANKPDNFKSPYPLLGSISAATGAFLDFGFCTSDGTSVGSFGRCAHNDDAASLVAQYNANGGKGYRSIGYVPLTTFNPLTGNLGFTTGTGASTLWGLFWDDSGAANDDNHDDLIGVAEFIANTIPQVVSVPEPGVLGLFSLGLVAGGMSLRRARNKA